MPLSLIQTVQPESREKSSSHEKLHILVGAAVPPDPNAGASGTVWQMNQAYKRLGHDVDEIWQSDLGRRIGHGNLHYLLELPWTYRRAVRQRLGRRHYDVIELNQPHAYVAAADHTRRGSDAVFVNRSHGHEVRSEEALAPWRKKLGLDRKPSWKRAGSKLVRRLLDRQWELIARTSDGFVVSCQEDRDFLVDRYGVAGRKIGVITQGVPDDYLNSEPAEFTAERARRLIYVGQMAYFKAPFLLAAAVSRVLAANPELEMTWVCGRAHHDEAIQLVDATCRKRVTLLDWMPQSKLVQVLDRHGIFLFPSLFEGFGKAPLEAMARGLCVVASDTGGMRDYISDGASGRLTPVGQVEEMARVVLELASSLDRCRKMSQAARATAVLHTWDRCAADAVVFYRTLIHEKRLALRS